MTKTPKQLAVEWLKEEYGDTSNWTYMGQEMSLDAFYAGYQAAQQWISVKDRLPEEGVEVLFHSPEKEMNCCFVGYRATENEYVDPEGNGLIARQIEKYYTHWMPLPAPPKEDR